MAKGHKLWLKVIQGIVSMVLAVPLTIRSFPAQTDQNKLVWGAPVNGLEMSLSLGSAEVPQSRTPGITLRLRNVGANYLRVPLGGDCVGGEVPNEVILNLTDSSGNIKRLTDHSGPAACGGIPGELVARLPRGKVYSIPLKLYHYKTHIWSPTANGLESGWQPGGTYTLQAVLSVDKVDPFFQTNWAGTVTSNQLEIHFPAQ